MTNFSFTCTPPSNYMHICTKGRKTDVILDSFFFQISKCFVAQIAAPIEKLSSQKNSSRRDLRN